jgi:16S rRNA (guanine966-N2)-methyltransferase
MCQASLRRLTFPVLPLSLAKMRVAGGVNRGQRLRYPRAGLRPTRNIVKQAIINMLRPCLPGARVLDLFCGAGALGIEALSAGAVSAVFVEQDRRTVALLRENLRTANCGVRSADCSRIIPGDAGRVLTRLLNEQFDIILADPPYEQGLDTEILALVARHGLLKSDGVIVLEHSRRDRPQVPEGLVLVKAHRYGDTIVSTIRNAEWRLMKSGGIA